MNSEPRPSIYRRDLAHQGSPQPVGWQGGQESPKVLNQYGMKMDRFNTKFTGSLSPERMSGGVNINRGNGDSPTKINPSNITYANELQQPY